MDGTLRDFRGDTPGALFLTSTRRRLASASALHQIFAHLGDETDVDRVYPHRFRHTFATWAIEAGAREIDVHLLLGHTSLTMTQRYARSYTSAQAVRAHARMSPVAQLAPEPPVQRPAAEVARPVGNHGTHKCWRDAIHPGMVLQGQHRGVTVTCTVVRSHDGVAFQLSDGTVFGSVSAAARRITGTQVNGYRFWSPV